VKNAELEARAEIERLNNLLRLALDEKADVIKEIERLRADIRGRAEAFRRVEVEIIQLRNRVMDLEAGVARDREQLAEVDAEGEQSGSETEIEQLRKKATQRGARMQIMREWMATRAGMRVWASFCLEHPEAADWFDADGVPK
jgi:predicted nuclease with TOPRIM domain